MTHTSEDVSQWQFALHPELGELDDGALHPHLLVHQVHVKAADDVGDAGPLVWQDENHLEALLLWIGKIGR